LFVVNLFFLFIFLIFSFPGRDRTAQKPTFGKITIFRVSNLK
jgi:hypothetical protein